MNGTLTTPTQRYLDAVRAHLADVPQQEREDLLEDLEQHLDEVAAEEEGSLEDRLGSPADYAAELRASAGLEGRRRPRVEAVLTEQFQRLRVIPHGDRFRRAQGAFRELRPAWWVIRGYVLLVGFRLLTNEAWYSMPVPRFGGSIEIGLVAIAGAVWASVWLGHRKSTAGRMVGVVLSGLAVIAGLSAAATANSAMSRAQYMGDDGEVYCEYPPCGDYQEAFGQADVHGPNGRPIDNIYAYDEDGGLLRNVRLYDQRGKPISILRETTQWGRPVVTSFPVDMQGRPVTNAFPQQQAVQGASDSKPIEPPTLEVLPLRAPTSRQSEATATQDDRRAPSRDRRADQQP